MSKLFLLIFTTSLLYAQTIVWNSVEFPPSLITQGELKDKGYSDNARVVVAKTLKQYNHELIYANSARIINNLKQKENNCFAGLNKNPDRENFILFSEPFMYSLPNELIIKKENLHKFQKFMNKDGVVDLELLLKDKTMKLLYTKERAYSKFIDKLLRKYENQENIIYRPASDLTKGFLKMLDLNRADYIIEYPVMVKYNSKSDNEYASLAIKNANKIFPVYIGCSKTKVGEDVIRSMNEVIKENELQFNHYYADFLPKDTKKRYLDEIKKH